MTCHSQIWTNAELPAPVRRSLAENKPLRWTRVYTLPDYVYFDHSIHVAKGVGCTECHGELGDMPLTRKATTLYMSWCLSCHRDPAPHLRPRDQVFNPHWQRTADTPSGEQLMVAYHIHPETLSDCGVWHRRAGSAEVFGAASKNWRRRRSSRRSSSARCRASGMRWVVSTGAGSATARAAGHRASRSLPV